MTTVNVNDLTHAAILLIDSQFGSAAMLQRKMGISFSTAGTVMDRLEELGVVGPQRGPSPRDVLVKAESKAAALEAVRAGRLVRAVTIDPAVLSNAKQQVWVGIAHLVRPDSTAQAVADQAVQIMVQDGWTPPSR